VSCGGLVRAVLAIMPARPHHPPFSFVKPKPLTPKKSNGFSSDLRGSCREPFTGSSSSSSLTNVPDAGRMAAICKQAVSGHGFCCLLGVPAQEYVLKGAKCAHLHQLDTSRTRTKLNAMRPSTSPSTCSMLSLSSKISGQCGA